MWWPIRGGTWVLTAVVALALILPDDRRAAEATFYAMTGPIKFSDQMYVSPRLTSYVQITC